MAATMTYEGVSEEMLACMKRNGTIAGTEYDPPEGNRGIATTKVPIFGNVVLSYDLDPSTQVISYEIRKKPGAVPESAIWDRVSQAIAACQAP